jgi:hypothetical protein
VAEEVQVRGTTVKIRNPLLVFVWSLVTLGIYYVVWYYKVNRELRDACGVTVNPLVAVLAVTIGWILIVPPFVSWYRTFTRIVEAQRNAGLTHEASPILGFILYVIAVFILPVELIYAQDELNKLWRARERCGAACRSPKRCSQRGIIRICTRNRVLTPTTPKHPEIDRPDNVNAAMRRSSERTLVQMRVLLNVP